MESCRHMCDFLWRRGASKEDYEACQRECRRNAGGRLGGTSSSFTGMVGGTTDKIMDAANKHKKAIVITVGGVGIVCLGAGIYLWHKHH